MEATGAGRTSAVDAGGLADGRVVVEIHVEVVVVRLLDQAEVLADFTHCASHDDSVRGVLGVTE